ncbi:AmpG family muropeptide MFS transporter [Thauera linaloolentis]|uniref:HNH endonuclease n=1 Tax=Thauera linaloolentis (strain DSM 12138 / JCM 21573 / CCUG 41526 / CIP 105981 / IAM 15112 / NBRC 102519 / 47Lol) TaxID=1123367 RepID=N6Y4K3_THAL4|nr:MFS transporter [Thauera linaloolentis]ENO86520.1 HNH endonuclease [Thauera linaloolentis 47Lol = DSM 12138]MCM8566493.1 MFS transporter [Thauera linaloolentis]
MPAAPPPALARAWRLFAILVLGFASGLPLALTGQAMQAWLTIDGVDLATIGFFGLVGVPYTFKFLWAPLMDRFEPPWLGRRRGWLALTQLALAALLWWMASLSPVATPGLFAAAAVLVAFLSASQDVVVDAYRTDLLPEAERGLGASVHVFAYRLAMILSGGIALIWAGQWASWPRVYETMALIMLGCGAVSLLALPRVSAALKPLDSDPRRELLGFAAMLAGVAAGYWIARQALILLGLDPDDANRWIQLLFVLAEIALAMPLAWWAARRAGFETLNRSLSSYFAQQGAAAFLALIILYKLGDAFAGSLTTPFLIKGMGFSQEEVGIANKVIGIWLTILGAFIGGLIMTRLALYRSLLLFGVLQLVSNFGFYLLAQLGKGAWGAVMVPAFDWGIVSLDAPAALDLLLLAVIAGENISGGMGTVAFVALLMGLCNQHFTATHYAMLSAFAAVGRIYVSPLSGVLSQSIGWPAFFIFSIVVAIPGVVMVWWLRDALGRLGRPRTDGALDD